jgi:diketogulonate reductase-like aldo/keto reductase
LGFGTFDSGFDDKAAIDSVLWALEAGYRHIDTAACYKNEEAIGKAIRQSGIPREDLFVTTKLWNEDMRQDCSEKAFEESLEKLGLSYVDLYLLHWPIPNKYVRCWKVLEKIYEDKKVRAIGVSNFTIGQLENIAIISKYTPAVNQCEFHPNFAQPELHSYCTANGIAYEAYKPLGQGAYAHNPVLLEIAKQNNKSVFQVILRWCLQNDVIAIPKSLHREYIRSNIDIYDFELDIDDMKKINAMDKNKSLGSCTPECFDF